ncbi:Predicted Fe-Mo cluster-binding protein, NifX family [Tistlia consotensis]|uniref:Predicted Fe-Mo cluster-binding protein, NifX family n=1 Tax=Tistlia consotensis USBA 355 TaxID=560819 RepID=A0A1Y6BTB5_9PROT|nr:NifB/NifX family molybdenum-iron cluster-binding protein [Tistlia consotensis]SMF27903.1 Predicted Fe-Mo cluster-binding protein, NifX family [Tistlia consotensis USBA 355]SNR65477.1 Predicted Fe-Mo cluster-binding protein, NifX family [Tistlia consotensis]
MTHKTLESRSGLRIAVTVMGAGSGPAPCPFFGKCDGIVVTDTESGAREFHQNPLRTPATLCDVILASGVDGLVCGFIAPPEVARLRAWGIDVRMGSGRCSVDELVQCFCDLPEA